MKKSFIITLILSIFGTILSAQNSKWLTYAEDIYFGSKSEVVYVGMKDRFRVNQEEAKDFLSLLIFNSETPYELKPFKIETDEMGFSHTKYKIFFNQYELFGKMVIAHFKDGKLVSVNGDINGFYPVSPTFGLTSEEALSKALDKVGAIKYKWENKDEERIMQKHLNNPNFTYQPIPKKVLFEKNGQFVSAYQFNIYAEEPLYKADVFVDAINGSILFENEHICSADVPASALTKYSGTQTMTVDQNASIYRLREVARGNGIETYDLNNTSNYASAVDFTNSTTSWTTTGVDQAASDAHWGAEVTYDYFFNQHNRNSIDGNGFKLLSYVHYNTNYNNAFWDGQRMTYGDGNGSTFTILTALDVCGHEITHGLTSNTSGLIYSYESGALNESYSDIFGTLVENYGRPSNWDWKIGQDMTPSGNGIRNMQNPKLFSDPHTYQGQYWYTGTNDNGGVHTNSGVSNYWFYCLSAGATGTNDISNSYTVNSIGMINAARIAFRANTIYYTPSTNYANARILSIQAAKDLFGACSNEVIETTNAWYAVGVGAAYSPAAINPDFDANATNLCNIPAQVSFNNNTANGVTYTWDFGDNSALSTSTNPVHSYTANGVYAVKLKAVGCQSLSDSITKTAYITVNAPSAPTAIGDKVCQSGVMTLTASGSGNLNWYSNSTLTNLVNSGTVYTTPNLSNSTTYYVVNSVPNAPAFGGIPNNVNGGFLTNSAHYLIFDVAESGTLQSVVVYANSAGNRTFELRNSSSAVLSSTVINLSVGANTINLNFPLTPGSAYQLGLSGSSASDMYRTNSNTNYPYNVGGFVSITGSSAGNSYYYWSYNWKVQKEDCKSGATPVTATVNPNPAIQFNLSSSEVCRQSGTVNLSASPAGGTFSGNGVSGNSFDPAVGTGTFMVYYNVTDGNGCNGNDSIVMTVADCTGLNEINSVVSNMVIYPNPSSGNIYLQNAFIEGIELSYELTDAIGRVIIKNVINSKNYLINASELSNGIYFITLKQEDQKLKTIKFIKQ